MRWGWQALGGSLACLTAAAQAAPTPQALSLGGDFVAMVEVPAEGDATRLAIVTSDHARPQPKRQLLWLSKRGDRLAKDAAIALPEDAAAFDACRLDGPRAPATVLLVRPGGIYKLGDPQPLAATSTIFAQVSEESMPRVRLCFPLFGGEAPALVVPTLRGVEVFRPSRKGQAYARHALLPARAEAHYSLANAALRGEQLETTQFVSLRLDYPAITATDFNGDGLPDLCLSRGERLACYLQDAKGFSEEHQEKFYFPAISQAELQDQSIRVSSQLVDVDGKGSVVFLLTKTNWNLADMQSTLYLFRQRQGGGFAGNAVQTFSRKGYFAHQELVDLRGEGKKDIVAPAAASSWSDLMHIFLSKSADVDFLWFANQGGSFASSPEVLYSLKFPIDFKHLTLLLSALPLWHLQMPGPVPKGEHRLAFFPKKEAVEIVGLSHDGGEMKAHAIARFAVEVGNEALATDLDGDRVSEIVLAYPKDAERGDQLVFIDLNAKS